MKLLPFDRHGADLATQLDLTDDERPDGLLPNRYHVHVCVVCDCEFVCTDGDCKRDRHNYGADLRGCAGCDLPLYFANTGDIDYG